MTYNYPAERDGVEEVELVGVTKVDSDHILDGLATAGPSSILGLFVEYEVFDEDVLARDLERVERYYRARGYYEAKVTAARVLRDPEERRVTVQIVVREGEPVVTRSVRVTGIELLPGEIAIAAFTSVKLRDGQPFDEEVFEETKQALGDALADRGYAFVEVTGKAKVDVSRREAHAEFHVVPGRVARYGPVRIFGLKEIPEGPVRDNLLIVEGEPFSRSDLVEARNAIMNLNVFATVEVREEKTKKEKEQGIVPINVIVRESALRTVSLGGGSRFDVLQLEAHLRAGWEHRNFLGGMRHFSVDAQPGVILYPTRFDSEGFRTPSKLLPIFKTSSELRQPAFIEGRTTGFIGGGYEIYPLLYPLTGDPALERIIGYHQVRARTGVERAFFNHHLFVETTANWQANFPFMYQVPPGQRREVLGLDTVEVRFPELVTVVDFRDDPIHPNRGVQVSNNFQVAGHVFGGSVSDVRVKPEARFYVPLHRYNRRWTLASRLTLGFLFPSDYGETLDPATAKGKSLRTNPQDPGVIDDQHKLLFRAFYSGGPTSNRGYPFRGVGPHGPIGFLVPTGADCNFVLDNDPNPTLRRFKDLDRACIRPLGGLTLWEASIEARFPIAGNFGGSTFLDASDVTRSVGEIRFDFPHVSVGPGLRYDTPVGPLRLDIGYRIPGLQQVGEAEPRADEGKPSELIPGLPIAVHLAFGEAF